jgi:hypothetical protein
MTRHLLLCRQAIAGWTLVLVPVLTATVATAQSLDEVARRESDRRTHAESGRVYTNADLAAVDPPSPAPKLLAAGAAEAPTSPAAAEPGPVVETDATANSNFQSANGPSEKKDRNYWHTTAVALRERLARTKAEATTQRDQLAAIGEGPETPTAVRARDVISKTLTRLQREAASQELELTRFLTSAQLANVPEEWFRE